MSPFSSSHWHLQVFWCPSVVCNIMGSWTHCAVTHRSHYSFCCSTCLRFGPGNVFNWFQNLLDMFAWSLSSSRALPSAPHWEVSLKPSSVSLGTWYLEPKIWVLSTDSTGLSVRIFLWLPWNVSSDILSPKEKNNLFMHQWKNFKSMKWFSVGLFCHLSNSWDETFSLREMNEDIIFQDLWSLNCVSLNNNTKQRELKNFWTVIIKASHHGRN